jgi:p-cumate 2,3-dioxygenase beta subunit
MSAGSITHHDLEIFLFEEAALLDSWKLKDWLALFTPDGEYQVPALDFPDADPSQSLYLIDDDHERLSSRVNQLLGRFAYSENPRSRTRRSISNVLFNQIDDTTINVRANFIIHRFKQELLDTFVGHYDHMLIRTDGRLLFKQRRALLDHEALRPQGKISIII